MRILEFQTHDDLNSKLWDNDTLRPDVKSALIKIAKDFKTFIDVPFKVVDIVITGGQVSYYYTEHSDLDLHLVVDFDSVACDREAAELFDAKRLLYAKRYDITVKGIPVELYVEDDRYPAVSASYSVLEDRWIKHPAKQEEVIDREKIEKMSSMWQNLIEKILASNDIETAKKCLSLLRKYRKMGLKTSGEYGVENLVYKTLRNKKTLEHLVLYIDKWHDDNLSLNA